MLWSLSIKLGSFLVRVGGFLLPLCAIMAQLEVESIPLKAEGYNEEIPIYTLPYLDSDSLRSLADRDSNGYFWSITRELSIGYKNGKIKYLYDAQRNDTFIVWRVGVRSLGALFFYLMLDTFWVPCVGTLYVYAPKSSFRYKVSCKNNKPYRRLSIGPIEGDFAVIEYRAPKSEKRIPLIHIRGVAHSFRDMEAFVKQERKSSLASCHVDVICEHPNWCNERRAVVGIFTISTLPGVFNPLCSGVLLNNERRDGRPYVLTAFHCLDADKNGILALFEKNAPSNWVFVFNYQAGQCGNPNQNPGFQYQISGAYFRAARAQSDFALLELSTRPPGDFNVFYAGWSNDDFRSKSIPSVAAIHHPQGDLKKIATGTVVARAKVYYNFPSVLLPVKVWTVLWNKGVTEPGSSGAPLFALDPQWNQGIVIGQLYGGISNCFVSLPDYFGRFYISWDEGSSPDSRLKEWLNPNASIRAMTGYEPCKISYYFSNANDLHTSVNVNGTIPFNPLVGQRSYDGVYMASHSITAGNNVLIQSGTSVTFLAKEITLEHGFTAEEGCDFTAIPEPCLRGCYTGVGRMSNNNSEWQGKLIANSIQNRIRDIQFSLFPNPARDRIFIRVPENYLGTSAYISLYNLYGKRVLNKVIKVNKGIISIGIQDLSRGTYLVYIKNKLIGYVLLY